MKQVRVVGLEQRVLRDWTGENADMETTGTRRVLCLLLLGVAGCGTEATEERMNRITPRQDDALARNLIAALLREDYEFIRQNVDERASGETPRTALERLYEYIDHDAARSVELVGCNVFSRGTQRQSRLTYQLEFPHSWYTANLVTAAEAGTQKAAST